MPPSPSTHISRDLALFAGLTRSELRRASALFTLVHPPVGTGLGREGDIGREFVVVLAGHVVASARGVPVAVLGPGDHFGAVPLLSLAGSRVRRTSFQMLEAGAVAVATRAEFVALCNDVPGLDRRVRAAAERALSWEAPVRSWEDQRTLAPSPSSPRPHRR